MLWNELFDLLWDWAIVRTHQQDQEIEDVIKLIDYMSDFIRPFPCASMIRRNSTELVELFLVFVML